MFSVFQQIADTWSSRISLSVSFFTLASVVLQLLPSVASPDYTPAGISTHERWHNDTSCFLKSPSFIHWRVHWIAQSLFCVWFWVWISQCSVVTFSWGVHELFLQVLLRFPTRKHVTRCSCIAGNSKLSMDVSVCIGVFLSLCGEWCQSLRKEG